MDEKQLTKVIRDVNADRISDTLDLWPQLEQRLSKPMNGALPTPIVDHHTSQRMISFPRPQRTRQIWLIASVLLILLTATVVFAVQQIIRFGQDAGIDTMQETGQVVPLDLTYNAGNASITLDYAYADANRITVAYTYNLGIRYLTTQGTSVLGQLQTADGQTLVDVYSGQPQMGGGGGGGGGGGNVTPTPTLITATASMIQNFDAASIAGQASGLSDEITLKFILDYSVTSDIEGESYSGQAVFDFSIPFNPGIVVEAPAPAAANEVTLTLEHLVAAPSMTRLDLCLESNTVSLEDYSRFDIIITHAGETIYAGVPEIQQTLAPEDTCRTLIIPDALQDQLGMWEVRVTQLIASQEPPVEAIIEAAADDGITIIANTPGPGYGIENLPDNSVEKARAMFARLDQISFDLRKKWVGPWVFEVTLE